MSPGPERFASSEGLAAMSDGEEQFGPKDETIREMIRNVYHCKSKQEEERFLRRYLAS